MLLAAESYQDKSYNLILGDAKKAFDLSQEKDSLRGKYGRNHFGQCCLRPARGKWRSLITVNMGGWDTHSRNFESMKERLGPTLDGGLATLLEDLAQRGLLDSTIVTCYGEFGRTPKVDWQGPGLAVAASRRSLLGSRGRRGVQGRTGRRRKRRARRKGQGAGRLSLGTFPPPCQPSRDRPQRQASASARLHDSRQPLGQRQDA